jgi:peptidoglycan/LPS O-acetylase OafA/YrhL
LFSKDPNEIMKFLSADIYSLNMRVAQIDMLKGLAAISVVILHSMPYDARYAILAPYHIWQAMPIFLILLGYNGAKSYMRFGSWSLKQCYFVIPRRLRRLFWPYTTFIALEFFGPLLLKGLLYNPTKLWLFGGYGMGSYFTPIVVQLILIFPLLYLLSIKNRYLSIAVALAAGIGFDAFAYFSNMDRDLYRLIGIRYLFPIALGIYLARNNVSNLALLAAGIIGASWIAFVSINLGFPPAYPAWHIFSPPSFLWGFCLVALGLRCLPSVPLVEWVGRASYHIFLAQSLYFYIVGAENFPSPLIIVPNALICIASGQLFYILHRYMSWKLHHLSKAFAFYY